MSNLNKEIDRTGTGSVKWEFIYQDEQFTYGDHAHKKHGADRILPMWVADMDFPVPQAVTEALVARARHSVFGYTMPTDSYFDAVVGWMARRHNWQVQPEWIALTAGVVPAINYMVKTFVPEGEKVLIQRPVYHPFTMAIENNNREVVSNSLVYKEGRYWMDFEDLAQKAADPAVKMMVMCSPHNPVGRIWSAEELSRVGEICLENNVLVVSDEIHCDLLFSGQTFTPFASINDEFAQNSLTCTAPSKTFNLAGLSNSNIIIPNEELRGQFQETLMNAAHWFTNIFGIVATEAAYTHGDVWLDEVMHYVEDNYLFMKDYLAAYIPQIKLIEPEGTYLVWADCRDLGIDAETRKKLIFDDAKVYLDEGAIFGPEGEDFERFNLACPRHILEEALERIKAAISSHNG
ncbi:MAG: MalY/PatB family protein [Chloroflexota bacterium]